MSHAIINITEPTQSAVARFLFLSGGSGVDLFFQISGFILVVSTLDFNRSKVYVANFIWRRALRIWPAYIAATLLFMSVGYGLNVFLDPAAQDRIVRSLLFQPLNFNDPAPFYGYSALAVGWTLNYEIYFYLAAAVSMLFGKWRWAALLAWFAVTLAVIPLLLGDFSFASTARYDVSGYMNLATNPILWNFVAGILAGLFYTRYKHRIPRTVLRIPVLLAVLLTIALLVFRVRTGHGLTYYGLGYFFILLTVSAAIKAQAFTRCPKILVGPGKISYSIYLIHPTVQYIVPTVLISNGLSSWTTGLGMAVGTTLLSIGFAFYFAKLFEKWLPHRISTIVAAKTPKEESQAA
jgi:peptidoglycan/LPS O-acetylase OafA/YrhL